VDQDEQRAHELRELSAQMARVKEKTRPWKETIALAFAIAAAAVSVNATSIFSGVIDSKLAVEAVRYALAVVFFVLAMIAVLGISSKVRAFFEPRVGSAHAAVIRPLRLPPTSTGSLTWRGPLAWTALVAAVYLSAYAVFRLGNGV